MPRESDRPLADPAAATPIEGPNEGGPPQIAGKDPVAPETHVAGGTYAPADYSPAAQRSKTQVSQNVTPVGRQYDMDKSGFEEAEGREGPAGPGAQ